jgi:hypothetical protein
MSLAFCEQSWWQQFAKDDDDDSVKVLNTVSDDVLLPDECVVFGSSPQGMFTSGIFPRETKTHI